MAKKKLQEVAPEPETVEAATELQEVAPVVPEVSQKTPVCYYVWNENSEFVKSFHENDHHGEAKKQAEAFASGHEGWTVSA